MRYLILLVTIFCCISCNQNNAKEKELELKEKELALKQKELDLKQQELALTDSSKSQSIVKPLQTNALPTPIYKVILKNVTNADGSKRGDIYFNINSVDYLVQKDEWVRNWNEFENKGSKLMGCSVGKMGDMEGYEEFWIEKSKGYLLIKSYSVGGNAQIEDDEVIKKIKL